MIGKHVLQYYPTIYFNTLHFECEKRFTGGLLSRVQGLWRESSWIEWSRQWRHFNRCLTNIYIYTLGAGGSPGTPAPWVLIYMKLRVGWGGDDNVPCTCTHGRCYATSCSLHLANLVDATQVLGWGGGGDDNVPCTCTHGRCYVTSCSLQLNRNWDALVFLKWVVML